jgi:hypothetical protein
LPTLQTVRELQKRLRPKTNFLNRFKSVRRVGPLATKIPLAPSGKSAALTRAILLLQEGRIAIVTDVGCRMRWTCELRETNAAHAYGKIVWS